MFRRRLVSSEYIFHVEIHNTEEIFLRQPESQFLRKFLELITKKTCEFNYSITWSCSKMFQMNNFNPLMPGGNKKVTHT